MAETLPAAPAGAPPASPAPILPAQTPSEVDPQLVRLAFGEAQVTLGAPALVRLLETLDPSRQTWQTGTDPETGETTIDATPATMLAALRRVALALMQVRGQQAEQPGPETIREAATSAAARGLEQVPGT